MWHKILQVVIPALFATIFFSVPIAAAAPSPSDASANLQAKLDALAHGARPARLGIAVLDLKNGTEWKTNAKLAFPMMSVFKAPVAATVLSLVDQGKILLQQNITVTRADLRAGASTIADHFQGDSMTFTVEQLLEDAVSHSDNTAADALIKLIGGPNVVTRFLQAHGIDGMRVDLDEGGVSHVFSGLGVASQPPANEAQAERDARLQRGFDAYLADPRNRSTPDAAILFLHKLWGNELLSHASSQKLLDLMYSQTTPSRLRIGIPPDVRLANKSGTSISLNGVTAAYNDIGILTFPDGHSVLIAAFLMNSSASQDERDKIFADLARDIVEALHS